MNPISKCVIALLCVVQVSAVVADEPQYYEVRSYLLSDAADVDLLDGYLSKALIPALKRQGIPAVGAFGNAANDESGTKRIVLVIPYKSPGDMASIQKAIRADAEYQAAGKDYLSLAKKDEVPFVRISSELLAAMDCWPELKVLAGTLENSDRVFELRLYESPNERLGNLKVDMFNEGEVPIFLDCKIQPIFIGQCVIGPQSPSLTYLTMYENETARLEAWKAFQVHPDWKVLREVAKYKGTVSKNDKCIMTPKPYSEM